MERTIAVMTEAVKVYLLDDRSSPDSAKCLGEAMRQALNEEFGPESIPLFQAANTRARDEVMRELLDELLEAVA